MRVLTCFLWVSGVLRPSARTDANGSGRGNEREKLDNKVSSVAQAQGYTVLVKKCRWCAILNHPLFPRLIPAVMFYNSRTYKCLLTILTFHSVHSYFLFDFYMAIFSSFSTIIRPTFFIVFPYSLGEKL